MNTERKPGYYRVKLLGRWEIMDFKATTELWRDRMGEYYRDSELDEIIETPISHEPQGMTITDDMINSIADATFTNKQSRNIYALGMKRCRELLSSTPPPAVITREVTDEEASPNLQCKLRRFPKDCSIIQYSSFKLCVGCGHYIETKDKEENE